MRIIVLGNGVLAARLAQAVWASRHTLVAVADDGKYYSSCRRVLLSFRGMRWASKESLPYWAWRSRVPLYYLDRLDASPAAQLRHHHPDILLVGGFARRLPAAMLGVPSVMPLNCHPSLLPQYRGPDPIAAAILAGNSETGITFHQMEDTFDTGPVLAQYPIPIYQDMDWSALCCALCDEAAMRIPGVLDGIESGDLTPIQQDDAEASHAPKLGEADSILNWDESAVSLDRRVRALAGSFRPRFDYLGQTVYVTRTRVVEREGQHGVPGTLLTVRPHARMATGMGTLELLDALVLRPIPFPWPPPWLSVLPRT